MFAVVLMVRCVVLLKVMHMLLIMFTCVIGAYYVLFLWTTIVSEYAHTMMAVIMTMLMYHFRSAFSTVGLVRTNRIQSCESHNVQ